MSEDTKGLVAWITLALVTLTAILTLAEFLRAP